jgi:hypothetical protein
MCRKRYKEVLLPDQMAEDGSFPRELKRTKPYGYALFNADAMATVCQILSTKDDNLWTFQTPDGKSMRKGVAWIHPYIADKSKWQYKQDVMYWDQWPVRSPVLLFGGLAYDEQKYLDTWKTLVAWSATDSMRIRGGYQVATREPNTEELFAGPRLNTVGDFVYGDPCQVSTTAPWGNRPPIQYPAPPGTGRTGGAPNPNYLQVQDLCRQLINRSDTNPANDGTSAYDTTLGCSIPSRAGIRGTTPVATTTSSTSVRSAGDARWPSRTSTPRTSYLRV